MHSSECEFMSLCKCSAAHTILTWIHFFLCSASLFYQNTAAELTRFSLEVSTDLQMCVVADLQIWLRFDGISHLKGMRQSSA